MRGDWNNWVREAFSYAMPFAIIWLCVRTEQLSRQIAGVARLMQYELARGNPEREEEWHRMREIEKETDREERRYNWIVWGALGAIALIVWFLRA